MSSDRFPLKNIRKGVNGSWLQIHETSETIIVSGSVARLKEVPDNGTVHVKPIISGLTLVNTYPPSAGAYWVNYATGDIAFNISEEGQTYTVDYWKRGSLVDVEDINFLYNRIVESTTNPTSADDTYEIGTVWVNTNTSAYFICTDNTTDNAVWAEKGTGTSGTSGSSGTSGTSGIGGTSGTSGATIVASNFVYTQETPADVWYVQHNFGYKYVTVTVIIDDEIVLPNNITFLDNNNVSIDFSGKNVVGNALIVA